MKSSTVMKNKVIVGVLVVALFTVAGCNSKRLKQIGAIIAVGIAAKLIYDMVVDYQSNKVEGEDRVVKRYVKSHGALPEEPTLVTYQSSIEPGEVVTAGNSISVQSKLEVVRGAAKRNVDIQEKITIFDNEDNSKELKSLVKSVNVSTKTSGAFENEFTFTLPKGMPQGVYPVQTTVIVDGKELPPQRSQMQLVHVDGYENKYFRVAVN